MRAFEVQLNGERLCTAGVGEDGALTAIVDHVRTSGRNELQLTVSGLVHSIDEHVTWRSRRLRVGDEVTVKVVEAARVDTPRRRVRRDPEEERRVQEEYVREIAGQLGWTIVTGPDTGGKPPQP
jgi:hypothetical protein